MQAREILETHRQSENIFPTPERETPDGAPLMPPLVVFLASLAPLQAALTLASPEGST